jgi:hypothetical protein
MLIPEVMPSEIAQSYLARLKAINGYPSVRVTSKELRQKYSRIGDGKSLVQLPYLLAGAIGKSPEEFCRLHTLLPFDRAVRGDFAELTHGSVLNPKIVQSHGMKLPEPAGRCCPRCVREDIEFWGYAYLRREHQLPGVVSCGKHEELLVWTDGTDALSRSPTQILDSPAPILHGLEPSITRHPVVSRYISIAENWLSGYRPIPLDKMIAVLQVRGEEVGVRRSKKGQKRLISDLALDACPLEWLTLLAPKIKDKKPGVYQSPLDQLFNFQSAAFQSGYYALALALLFDTAEEALNRIEAELPKPVVQRRQARRMGDNFWTGNSFTNLYAKYRGNPRHISRSLDLNMGYVREVMKKNGFPSLCTYSDDELRAFVSFAEGATLLEACRRHGVGQTAVEELARLGSVRLAEAIRSLEVCPSDADGQGATGTVLAE